MNDCLFCKIANKEISSIKIWEDDSFYAFLDINPNTEGMTLVISKNHYESDIFELPDEVLVNIMHAGKKVAKILEKGLSVKRVSLVVEGMGVNHIHLKLYPLHGLEEKFKETWAKNKVYFDRYNGYISTQLGPQKTQEELQKTANKILPVE